MISHSPEETDRVAARLAELLSGGEILLLSGELGAGKTRFTQGLAGGLGIPETEVSSPTFVLIQEYHGGRLPLYHMDFYRLESFEELEEIGYEEYFFAEGVSLAEWGELFPEAFPEDYLEIKLERVGDFREISFIPHGEVYQKIVEELKKVDNPKH